MITASSIPRPGRATIAALLLAALSLMSSCASGGEPTSGGGQGVSVVAEDNTFEPEEISASPGAQVAVTLENEGNLPHTFTIRKLGVDTGTVAPGESAEVEFEAPENDVTFICTIHEAQGQVGRLVVE